ncbi:MAG TPA: hypothetical protein VE568_13955 [Rubrobacter sp.]|nr:hypothetical protein [Rubrobacter sp.]
MDVLDLSRLQFAVTASFRMTFPAVTVGWRRRDVEESRGTR